MSDQKLRIAGLRQQNYSCRVHRRYSLNIDEHGNVVYNRLYVFPRLHESRFGIGAFYLSVSEVVHAVVVSV